MKVLGIDLGSREVKIVLMENESIIKKIKFGTMSFYRDYCIYNGSLEVSLEKLGIQDADICVSTGYGRNNTNLNSFKAINEIKAHVYGAVYQTGTNDFTLLDVGGQDVKAVRIQKGMITDLELNDKCAASCGRYLENMANVLEIPLEVMTGYIEDPVELNSTCAVFSESELIGKIAEGIGIERLCAGVNYSLYKKLQPILGKFKSRKLVLSGGVAKGKAIKNYLEKDFDEVVCVEDPQYNGAIGCCYYGKMRLGGGVKCIQ